MQKKKDLLLVNGSVLTMDPTQPDGNAIAVKDGIIRAVGKDEEIKSFTSTSAQVINLQKRTVLPGFIDAHLHLRALAESLTTISLNARSGVKSISHIIARIRNQARMMPSGTWIRAGGYNEIDLVEKRHPDRWDLDRAAPNHPVKLIHRSGHAHVLNSLGLKLTGIHRETDDPQEGIIDRDLNSGEPTGMLWGLNDFLSKKIPPLDDTLLADGVRKAEQKLLSCGITSFQDASPRNNKQRWQWYEGLKDRGLLKPRTTMMVGTESLKEFETDGFSARIDVNDLCIKGVKIVIDETTGSLYPDPDILHEWVLEAHRTGHQIALHAIESSAIEAAVQALSHALSVFPRKNHRHRIEHCSVCPPELIRKIASLDAMVTTHPAFLYYSGERYLKTVPLKQQPHLYPIASLLKAGIPVAAASDAPIAEPLPMPGIYSAITRVSETGKVINANETVSPETALQMYTVYPAMALFQEGTRGMISPGKLADLVVLSDNPLKVPENNIKDITVIMTIIGGEIVWTREDF